MSAYRPRTLPARDTSMLAFASSFFVFHHLPAVAGGGVGDWIDLVTPFAVVAATTLAVASAGVPVPVPAMALAIVGAVLYIDGHGIHLAANAIGHEALSGDAVDVTHFWDEDFGHIEWHLGWITLVASLALAEALSVPRHAGPTTSRRLLLAALLLGTTLFTSTVEGGTWWLALAGAAILTPWAVARRRSLLLTCAGAFCFAAALIAVWAIWHAGVPQFSDVGWL